MKTDDKKEQQYNVTPAEYARAKKYRLNYLYGLLAVGRVKAIKTPEGKWLISAEELGTTHVVNK